VQSHRPHVPRDGPACRYDRHGHTPTASTPRPRPADADGAAAGTTAPPASC